MKVGLPRALLFYYYYPLWQAFFHNLGVETVVSRETTRDMVDAGVRFSVAEICLPIKIFAGHAASLVATDVDYIFVPRMVTVEKAKHFCPKFIGLPDMMREIVPGLAGRLLAPDVRCRHESLIDIMDRRAFAEPLGVSERQVKKAFAAAARHWEEFRRFHRQGYTIDEALARLAGNAAPAPEETGDAATLNIGLLGYVYNIYDSFVGMDIIPKLRRLGARVVTFEMLDEALIAAQVAPLHKSLPWTFSNKLLGAGYSFFDDPHIDGLIHVTAFGCGPDSMLGRMLEFEAAEKDKPFMTIRVDEHTGEAHLLTRIEAFTDMLRRKKFSPRKVVNK